MTRPLSPATEAVLFAFLNGYVAKWNGTGCRSGLAAALRAAADTLAPTQADRDAVPEFHAQCVMNGMAFTANELRLIANELDPRP